MKKLELKREFKQHVYLVIEDGVGCIAVWSTIEKARNHVQELSQYYDTNDAFSIEERIVDE